jgi:methanethiol S-methyltransferase
MGIFWLVSTVILWGVLHSLFASLGFKQAFARLAGPFLSRFYRLFYNIFSGFSFLGILAVAFNTPDRKLYTIPFPWSALFILIEVAAVVALGASFLQTDIWEFIGLKQLESTGEKTRVDGTLEPIRNRLVTGGLYGYIRHPLYTTGMLIIWFVPIMTVNVLIIDTALTVYIVIGALFEERKLRREFGQAYSDYASVTPMFIPFLKWNNSYKKPSL